MQAVSRFVAAKAKADGVGGQTGPEAANALVDALHALTTLRAVLAGGLTSGAPAWMTHLSLALRHSGTKACMLSNACASSSILNDACCCSALQFDRLQ